MNLFDQITRTPRAVTCVATDNTCRGMHETADLPLNKQLVHVPHAWRTNFTTAHDSLSLTSQITYHLSLQFLPHSQ